MNDMENENVLLKIYRDYTESEAINLLKQEIASLLFKIGELKSEKTENNWLSLQDIKEVRVTKAFETLKARMDVKIKRLQIDLKRAREERDKYLLKIIQYENR